MLDLVAVDGPDRPRVEFGKGGQQIRPLSPLPLSAARIDLGGGLREETPAPPGVRGVEEGAALERGVEDFALLLQEIPTAAGLTEGAPHAQAREVPVADAGTDATLTGVLGDDFLQGSHELIQEKGVDYSLTGIDRSHGHGCKATT